MSRPRVSGTVRRLTALGSAATLGTLVLLIVSSFAVSATPVAASSGAPQVWTSSAQWWYNNTTTVNSSRGWASGISGSYAIALHYSVQDVVTATNTSSNTTELQGQLWVNESLTVSACRPNCTSPSYEQNYSYVGAEYQVQYLNLTDAASVDLNGSAVAALGVTNASAWSQSTLAASSSYGLNARVYNWTTHNATTKWISFSSSYTESQLAYYGVSFATPLGLLPWNASAGEHWNSTSAFTAAGGWNDSVTANYSSAGGLWSGSGGWNWGSSGTVNGTGRESVRGADLGNVTGANNTTLTGFSLRFRGPFNFDNNLFMTAIGSDLFSGATSGWTVQSRPGYGSAGTPVSSVYKDHLEPRPAGSDSGSSTVSGGTSTSAGTGPSGGTISTNPGTTSNGMSNVGGSSAGTTSSSGSTSPAPSSGTTTPAPTTTTPVGGSSVSSGLPTSRSPNEPMSVIAPLAALLVAFGAAGTLGYAAFRRPPAKGRSN